MFFEISELTTVVKESVEKCFKCNGSGYLQQHRRISGGVCFKCDGSGLSGRVKTSTLEKEVTVTSKAWEMGDEESFEDLLARRAKKMAEPFDIFTWFEDPA